MKTQAGAAEPFLLIPQNMNGKFMGKHIEYMEDRSCKLTISEVSDPKFETKFKTSTEDKPNIGMTESAYWMRFRVKNPEENIIHWFFEIDVYNLNNIDFYIPNEQNSFNKIETGTYRPFSTKQIAHTTYAFPLVQKQGVETYYVRLLSASVIILPFRAWSAIPLIQKISTDRSIYFSIMGIMIIMILYNAFIFIFTRERSFLYYVLFNIAIFFSFITSIGYGYQYIWKDIPFFNEFNITYMLAVSTAGTIFTRSYLETKKHIPKIDRYCIFPLLMAVSIIFIIFQPIYSFMIRYDYKELSYLFLDFASTFYVISIMFSYIIGIIFIIKRSRSGYYYFISLFFPLFFTLINQISSRGYIPLVFLTSDIMIYFGVAIMLALFSLGLGDKINTLNIELKDLNIHLEDKVEQRTKELADAMQKIEQSNKDLIEHQKIADKEIAIALNVQKGVYPKQPPTSDMWDIAYHFKPYHGVSGDLYDFYERDGIFRGVSLFDISGHGVSAGLITMLAKSTINRIFWSMNTSPLHSVIETINNELSGDLQGADLYLTGILLRFNESRLEYVNAAHPKLLLKREAIGKVIIVEPKDESFDGTILGTTSIKGKFKTALFDMIPGDSLLLYTDGITESSGLDKKEFGLDRLIESYRKAPEVSAQEIISSIINDFNHYVKEKGPSDDLTLILIKKR
jgi:sigma-B regulation protein RsbU (phosphoserine phosphatase)